MSIIMMNISILKELLWTHNYYIHVFSYIFKQNAAFVFLARVCVCVCVFTPSTFAVVGGTCGQKKQTSSSKLLVAVDRGSEKVITVQSLALSYRLFLCLPRLWPPWTTMVLERASRRLMTAKPRQLPSPDGCQERFLRTHEAPGQAPHIVIGLVLSVRDTEKFPQALGLECLDSLSSSASRVHVSHP